MACNMIAKDIILDKDTAHYDFAETIYKWRLVSSADNLSLTRPDVDLDPNCLAS